MTWGGAEDESIYVCTGMTLSVESNHRTGRSYLKNIFKFSLI